MSGGARARGVLVLALALGLPACRTRGPERPSSAPVNASGVPEPRPWTQAFLEEAALVADEIRIEGPGELLDHVSIRQDPDLADYRTRTVPEGLLQEVTVKPGVGAVAIRAQLDAWALAAFRRLVVLQRPLEVPVTVRATGNAAWIPAQGGGERRAASLAFRGVRGQ